MDLKQWGTIKEIVAGALDCSPGERAAFVRSACNGDHALRAEVESLLSEDECAGEFLLDSVMPASSRMKPLAAGEVLRNRFEILQLDDGEDGRCLRRATNWAKWLR
jgi:hypothetical protein